MELAEKDLFPTVVEHVLGIRAAEECLADRGDQFCVLIEEFRLSVILLVFSIF